MAEKQQDLGKGFRLCAACAKFLRVKAETTATKPSEWWPVALKIGRECKGVQKGLQKAYDERGLGPLGPRRMFPRRPRIL